MAVGVSCDPGVTPPIITGVSGQITLPATGNGAWSITVNGFCFGNTYPSTIAFGDGGATTQPSTTAPAIILVDQGSSGTSNNWGAGFGGDGIDIYLPTWTDNAITITGFGSSSGVGSTYPIASGDQIYIYLIGPDCPASTTPTWPTINNPPPTTVWPANCEASAETTVGSAFVTPVFPLGTILALLVPLAALGAYVAVKKGPAKYPNSH